MAALVIHGVSAWPEAIASNKLIFKMCIIDNHLRYILKNHLRPSFSLFYVLFCDFPVNWFKSSTIGGASPPGDTNGAAHLESAVPSSGENNVICVKLLSRV